MLARFNRGLANFCEVFAGVGVLVLATLVTATVFLRFVVGSPPHWAEELPRLVLVWATLVGAGHRRHVERVNDLLLVALFCLLGKAGWDLAQLTMSQTTTALQLPAGILYLAVPVGCAALALVHAGLLLQRRDPP